MLPTTLSTGLTAALAWLERTGTVSIWHRQSIYLPLGPSQPHIPVERLHAMKAGGFAATDVHGRRLDLHHLSQDPDGPLIETPALCHNVGNRSQHTYGNIAGMV